MDAGAPRPWDADRVAFRAEMDGARAGAAWEAWGGRIAVVLPGGGARGAYEAGVLLAFQDAALPTHIISATSIGAINAASYAANAEGLRGNAEPVVAAWQTVTPPAVGIEWTRYVWMTAGLIAASAGLGNLLYHQLTVAGVRFHLHHPALLWSTLALAGLAVLLLHVQLPYAYVVLRRTWRRESWRPDPVKLRQSLLANVLLAGFGAAAWESFHLHTSVLTLLGEHPLAALGVVFILLWLLAASRHLRAMLSRPLQAFGRLLVRPGLFENYERRRFLAQYIPDGGVRRSPMRLLLTSTDLEGGTARFFCNASREDLRRDPGVDQSFVDAEVSYADDPLSAVIASSALPIVYEPLPLGAHHFGDGGLVANQPIRPAIRLGAELVFVIMVDAPGTRHPRLSTFVDVGRRALDILIQRNVLADLGTLERINATCELAARQQGLGPEAVEVESATRRYRYVRSFTIRPEQELGTGILDFGDPRTGEVIARGYQDAARALRQALAYVREAPRRPDRRLLRLTAVPA